MATSSPPIARFEVGAQEETIKSALDKARADVGRLCDGLSYEEARVRISVIPREPGGWLVSAMITVDVNVGGGRGTEV